MKKLLLALVLAASSLAANAYTECTNTVNNVYAGDGGAVQVVLTGGMYFSVTSTDPNVARLFAGALFAKGMGMTVTVRFAATGVACSGGRTDFQGIFIL